ncbi:MAG: hypothetical protein PQJ58_11695 [Spirochaetales bacterium]|nr:hypothetical protein [Spirochaetales bacterium]
MNDRETLIRSINELLTRLEEKDLSFILQQAEVLDYNKAVLERRAAVEARAADPEASDPEASDSDMPSADSSAATKTVPRAAEPEPVYIEQTEHSKFFNICIGSARLFVDYQEVQALYKIARAASSAREAAPRLYRWLEKERSDILAEGNIRGLRSPVLSELYEALLDTFTAS